MWIHGVLQVDDNVEPGTFANLTRRTTHGRLVRVELAAPKR